MRSIYALIFPPPDWGMLRRSKCVQIFLQTYKVIEVFGWLDLERILSRFESILFPLESCHHDLTR